MGTSRKLLEVTGPRQNES